MAGGAGGGWRGDDPRPPPASSERVRAGPSSHSQDPMPGVAYAGRRAWAAGVLAFPTSSPQLRPRPPSPWPVAWSTPGLFFCGGKKRGFRYWRRRQVPAPRVTVSAFELKRREGGVLSVSGGGLSLEATLTHLNGDSRVVVGNGEGRPTPSRVHP